jgi:cyclophilin family peptidyl-prolyl cis-trans isomerase
MRVSLPALACALLLLGQSGPLIRRIEVPSAPNEKGPTPSDVFRAEGAWAGLDVLLPMLDVPQPSPYVIRAVGRLEDPSVVPRLLTMLGTAPGERGQIATAIAQSLKGFDPRGDPQLVHTVAERLREIAADANLLQIAAPAVGPIGRIAYAASEDVGAIEETLVSVINRTTADKRLEFLHVVAARSLEWLFRRNAKIATAQPETLKALAAMVAGRATNDTSEARRNAFAALLAARGLDADSEKSALGDKDPELRRMAMTVLAGSGGGLDDSDRSRFIADGLKDRAAIVRYEALRAFVRHLTPTDGCDRIVEARHDEAAFVRLAAIDALGGLCLDDEGITTTVLTDAQTPPTIGPWTLEAHAFVALAKRSRDRAAVSMSAFSSHPVWQVRMYAARAAAAMDDVATLEKLAYDVNDNVREAALGPLRRLKNEDADAAILAALDRRDYQLVRSAALLLKETAPSAKLARPLLDALLRITADISETSRDTRTALIEAIEVHGNADATSELEPLLKDFDPRIAALVAGLLTKWTGRLVTATPVRPAHSIVDLPSTGPECVAVALRKGPSFRMELMTLRAPVTAGHFLRLALRDHYYDGLTFHRVVPNFVIQGGSPAANEYSGQKEFMRDEIDALNGTGSVGLSTRGRNTGDAQFFVNLVENTRLDYDYTVFAQVFEKDMPVVYGIEEGDVISMVKSVSCDRSR